MEKIRAKNEKAAYKKSKRRRIFRIIKFIIFLALFLAIALFTFTTLSDFAVIKGGFVDKVNEFLSDYLPFVGPTGKARTAVTDLVQKVVDFFKGLF